MSSIRDLVDHYEKTKGTKAAAYRAIEKELDREWRADYIKRIDLGSATPGDRLRNALDRLARKIEPGDPRHRLSVEFHDPAEYQQALTMSMEERRFALMKYYEDWRRR